ncbi:MAG: sigma-70 family RNA polymerase sigma factor [Thermoguttaceae bacterium]|nr:sigma-70 family RNA polymerase sigma factor [Thermoguttaceae bacterium]
MSEKNKRLGDLEPERFEKMKADFIVATSPEERRRILGELMNDQVRDQFKKWVPDKRHISSVVQDYFMGMIVDFNPEKFVPVEERDPNKKKKIEFFDEFTNLDHFIAYSRKRLGWILCAHIRRDKKATPVAELPEVVDDNRDVDELIEREHVDYILKCFQAEFDEREYYIFASHALEEWSYPKIAEWWNARRDEEIDADKARRIYHKVEARCLRIWACCMQGRYYTRRFDPTKRADLGELNDGGDWKEGNDGDDDFAAGSPAKIKIR